MTYEQIISNLRKKVYHPVYFLMGDETFYIDEISDYIQEHVLDAAEKEFNQSVLYGGETDAVSLVAEAKRFPMMANYQVVIVKEAQLVRNMIKDKAEDPAKSKDADKKAKDPFLAYIENPLPSTILVICYKYKTIDKRKALAKMIEKNGVLFHSEKLKDYKVAEWIGNYVKTKNLTIGAKAASMLAEFLGNDLSKVVNEVSKLCIILPKGGEITAEAIEKNIGISKDYNVFELQDALGTKNRLKANRIINHFESNPKDYPMPVLMSNLYNYFTRIFRYHLLKGKGDNNFIASEMGVHPFVLQGYEAASRNFPVSKLRKIISSLREADIKSKGIENVSVSHGDLMKELVFKILY